MKALHLVGVGMLLLVCTACTSHLATGRPGTAGALAGVAAPSKPAEVPKAGGFGDSESKKKGNDLLLSDKQGSATDDHSDVESKTPDGGKSAVALVRPASPTAATPVVEGAEIAGADADKGGKDKGVADVAGVDKAGSDQGDGAATDAGGLGAASQAAGANKPMDESDPSIVGPSSAAHGGLI